MPLHAAGLYGGSQGQETHCADYVVSSYTPTPTTLLRAQRTVTNLAKNDLALTIVAECRAKDENLQTLTGIDAEIHGISAVAKSSLVNIIGDISSSTTIARAFGDIKAANIVHLACHGIQDHEDATQSGFCLGDGRLTISSLIDLDIKGAFLAFLSACETGKGSKDQPDQVMHLAATMLFIGFKSVVATMWLVNIFSRIDCS
jgi:CHAT domain-containing protein